MSTNVLFPPPRNVDNIECSRYRILFGRLSNSNSEARGSIASFMMESASEFAISYSFSSYKISYGVIYMNMIELTIPRPWASMAGLGSCETMFNSSLATATGNDGEVGVCGDWLCERLFLVDSFHKIIRIQCRVTHKSAFCTSDIWSKGTDPSSSLSCNVSRNRLSKPSLSPTDSVSRSSPSIISNIFDRSNSRNRLSNLRNAGRTWGSLLSSAEGGTTLVRSTTGSLWRMQTPL